ncbi:MAG: hypothetical protein IKO84_07685, partial [Butyrivibrio sp.]|nr:hypothetical protein [Butyrivibrio sp.]
IPVANNHPASKADLAGLVKVTLFSAIDMKKYQKTFPFILDISPLDLLSNIKYSFRVVDPIMI